MEIGVYNVTFRALTSGELPRCKGNLLRSVLGAQMTQVHNRTVFEQLFHGAGEGRPAGFAAVPPFAIACDDSRSQIAAGDTLQWRLTLANPSRFGHLLSPLLDAVAAHFGNVTCVVESGTQTVITGATMLAMANSLAGGSELTIALVSPLLIKEHKRPVHQLALEQLVQAACRRAHALGVAHGNGTPMWAAPELVENAAQLSSEVETRWVSWSRVSHRQHRSVRMGGLVGTMRVTGDLEPLLPLLTFASIVQVGSGVTMGNGVLRLSAASS